MLEFSSTFRLYRLATAGRKRKAKLERDAAEKKVDILQKALRQHPNSSDIILQLISAAQIFQEDDEIRKRWQVLCPANPL